MFLFFKIIYFNIFFNKNDQLIIKFNNNLIIKSNSFNKHDKLLIIINIYF